MKFLRSIPPTMLLSLVLATASGQDEIGGRVDKNVVYGMVSGAALLMDVYYPDNSNHRGIVFIQGSGWFWRSGYSAGQLKEAVPVPDSILPLIGHGYTVFAINHRLSPAFRYPAHVNDVHRAVRFIRANASQFNIDAEPLAGYGTSAGANLVGMLALQDGTSNPDSDDPAETLNSKLQAAVIRCGPLDLTIGTPTPHMTSYVGEPRELGPPPNISVSDLWIEASPVSYISEDDPPLLVTHAMDDPDVEFDVAENSVKALRDGGLDVEFIPRETGGHCAGEVPHDRILGWLDEKLLN